LSEQNGDYSLPGHPRCPLSPWGWTRQHRGVSGEEVRRDGRVEAGEVLDRGDLAAPRGEHVHRDADPEAEEGHVELLRGLTDSGAPAESLAPSVTRTHVALAKSARVDLDDVQRPGEGSVDAGAAGAALEEAASGKRLCRLSMASYCAVARAADRWVWSAPVRLFVEVARELAVRALK